MIAVFVYGTLRPGGGAFGLIADTVEQIEEAVVDGYGLYGLDRAYPFVRPDPDGRVVGHLVELNSAVASSVLEMLDRYEGPEYRRERVVVRTSRGVEVEAWVYMAKPEVDPGPEIPGGDWLGGDRHPSTPTD